MRLVQQEGKDAGVKPVSDQDPSKAHEGNRALEIFIMTKFFVHLILDLFKIKLEGRDGNCLVLICDMHQPCI